MRHNIPVETLHPYGEPMAEAIQACVHCGFCLSACPTYAELGQEMDSPRGRIVLMKEVLEGGLPLEDAAPHIDRCLGCLACEPACPSGVPYRDLLSPFRAGLEQRRKRSLPARLQRLLLAATLPYPQRFFRVMQLARLGRPLAAIAPAALRPMLDLIPADRPQRPPRVPERIPAVGETRARVALLLGCAQQVLAPEINRATIEVLTRNGVEVLVPPEQGCCGALAWHVGDLAGARRHARRNLRAFPAGVDAIVTNAAGCGSGLQEYPLMLRGEDEAERARAFAGRVMDVSAFLVQLGMLPPPGFETPRKVAYHEACHLGNGQGVRAQPREILQSIAKVELCEIGDAHLCCGSAGSYNMDQPEIAHRLGRKKAEHVLATGADMAVSGNIGCLIQLRTHLRLLGCRMPVRHTVEVLAEAWRSGRGARAK